MKCKRTQFPIFVHVQLKFTSHRAVHSMRLSTSMTVRSTNWYMFNVALSRIIVQLFHTSYNQWKEQFSFLSWSSGQRHIQNEINEKWVPETGTTQIQHYHRENARFLHITGYRVDCLKLQCSEFTNTRSQHQYRSSLVVMRSVYIHPGTAPWDTTTLLNEAMVPYMLSAQAHWFFSVNWNVPIMLCKDLISIFCMMLTLSHHERGI